MILAHLFAAAATPSEGREFLVAASVVAGLAAAVFGWWVVRVLQSEDIAQGAEWR